MKKSFLWSAPRLVLKQSVAGLLIVLLAATTGPVNAGTYYWDPDASLTGNNVDGTGLGGSGTWDASTANWWDLSSLLAWPNTNAHHAIFTYAYSAGLPTFNNVTLNSGIIANQLSFLRSGYTLTGGDLTLAGSGAGFFASLGTYTVIDSLISGTDGLTMTGGGTIRLGNNSNDYTGTTTLSNGALIITNQSALGLDSSPIVVTGFNPVVGQTGLRSFGGGSLVLDGLSSDITISRDLSLQGMGAISDRGAALISTGNNTLSGTVDMGVPYSGTNLSTRMIAADGALNLTGTLNILGAAGTTINNLGGLNQAGASFYNVTGVLAGTGTLESSGGGTLFLNPTDSSGFSGTIRVSGSAASGQSVVRIDSPNVLGTRTSSTTSAVLDLNGGVLAILMDAPSVQAGGSNANVYFRASSTIFADHTPGSSVKDQTVSFGNLSFEDNITLTFNSRNGYGMSFTTAPVNGGDNNTTLTNNLQGGALLSFTGNFWSNSNNTDNRTMTIGGNGNTLINGSIIASAAAYNHVLTKTGTGTLTLTGTASTLDGAVNASGGTVAISDWRAITNNTSNVNINGGILSVIGNNVSQANLTTSKVINLSGTTGSAAILANQTGTSPGLILNANFTATGAGTKTLTLGGTNTAANTINGAIVQNGTTNLTKIDPGTWVLAGTNTYTGATTISNGTLRLQANAAASTILADTSAITFNAVNVFAGGTLEFVGQPFANNVETLGALTPANGSGTVKLTPGSSGTASLVFASLGTVGDGSGLNIVGSDASNTVTVTGLATGLASPRIYLGGSDFARSNGGLLAAPVYGTDATFVNAPAGAALPAGQNNFSINGNITTQSTQIVSTLKFNGAQTLTLIPSATLTVRTGANNTDGGILATGGASIITGGTSVQTGGSGTLTIRVDGGGDSLRLETPVNAGTGGLTKNGAGTLIFAGANNQTGTISINEGTVRLSAGGQLGGAAALIIRQDGILEFNGVTPTNVTNAFNSTGIVRNTSATTDVTFTVGGADGTGDSRGIIEDGGLAKINVVKIGTGGQNWLGLSTYTGTTTIGSTGIVSINNLVNGGMASGIGASSSDASNLIFNGASTSQAYGGLSFTGTTNDETDRLFTFNGGANGGARIQSNGVNGATSTWTNTGALAFGPNATNNPQGLVLGGASTGDNRFFPIIGDNPAGLGAATSVYKADAGVWYLEATNTYTGATTIRGGALYASAGDSLPTASNLVLDGGSLARSGAFTRTIGTGANQVQWTAHGSGGFSAGGSPLTVDWGSGAVWGTGPFIGTGALLLNNSGVAKSDVDVVSGFEITQGAASTFNATTTAGSSTVTLTSGSTAGLAIGQTIANNPNIPAGYTIATITGPTTFTLNSGTGVTAATSVSTDTLAGGYRQVNVGDFTSIGADFATLSGVISGAGNLAKEGAGILNLRGDNLYTGQTLVRQGTLVVETLGNSTSLANTPTSVGISGIGTAFDNTNAIALGNGSTTAGILEHVGPGETSDRKIRLNTTTGSTQIHADGTGPLILTNVANDITAGAKLLYLRGVNSGGNMITSQLSDFGGALGVVVDGGTSWILTNPANDYTGTTTVSGGALGIGDDAALGAGILQLSTGNVFAYGADRTIGNTVRQSAGTNMTTGFIGDYSLTFGSLEVQATTSSFLVNNNIVAGKSLTFGGLTANTISAARTFTVDGSGHTIIGDGISTSTAFNLNITKTGLGTLTLGAGTITPDINDGVLTVSNGVLQAGADNVLNNTLTTNLMMNPAAGLTATLDLNGKTDTIRGLTANSLGTANIDNSSATAASLTMGNGDQDAALVGNVTNTGAGALSLTKTGTGAATFSGGTYAHTGSTNVNGGTLTFAGDVTATTALSVTGGSLFINGGFSGSTGVTSLTVAGGSTLALNLDSAGTPLSGLTSLNLGTGSGTATLRLNIGDLNAPGDDLNSDTITLLTGGTLNLTNTVTFNMGDSGLNPNQTYTLLHLVDGGLNTFGAANLIQGLTPGGFDSYTWINTDDNKVQLTVGNLVTGNLYWRGATGTTWNGNLNNWSTDKEGTIPGTTLPGAGIDVIFQWDAPTNAAVSTTLEQNFKIKSLTFRESTTPANTPTSVTIASGGDPTFRLQVAPAASTDGVKIDAGGPAAVTISSPFKLGADQTWSVADATSILTFAGPLQGEQDVTISGSGKIVLGAAANGTFNPGLTSDFTIASGTLELTNAGALGTATGGNTATVTVNTGGAFYYNGAANTALTGVANNLTLAGGTLSAGGNAGNNYYTGTILVSADSFINMRGSNSAVLTATQGNVVLSNAVSGTGKLTVDSINTTSGGNQYTGVLYFQQDNSAWSGGIDLLRGTIQTQTVTGLGTGDINASAGRIQFVTAAGTAHNLAQNITVDATGGILELSADASGTPLSDMTVNLSGTITIGSAANANNALRFSQASDNFSVFNISGPIVLGNNASITHQGSSVRPLIIPTVISDGGSGYSLAINDELYGWGVTSQTVNLTGLNTFSGNISISEGTLEFDSVTNIGGAPSALGQGSAITMGTATLRYIGDTTSHWTNRPITTTGSVTLSANGTNGASITYGGAITQDADRSLTLTGTGAGIITGGITQPAGTAIADLNVNSGDWTIKTGAVTIADDFLLNGGTVTLKNLSFGLNDDIVVTGSSAVLNLNSTGVWVPTNPAGTSSNLYARGGGVINLNAHDVNGVANANGTDFIILGDGTALGTGILNTNGFSITIPNLNVGAVAPGYDGAVTGNGTITGTNTLTDWSGGFRFYSGTIAANLAGGATILKQGLENVTLSGNNSGLTGSVAASTRIDAGNLILDYTSSNTMKLPSNRSVDLRGGALTLIGNNSAPTSETVGGLTLANGGSNLIQVTAGAGQTALLNLGAITRGNLAQDGTVRFILPSGAQSATHGITTTSPNSFFGMLGTGTTVSTDSAYATVDDGTGTWFATAVGGNVVALASTAKDDVATWVAGDHITDSTGFTGTLGAGITTVNSLRFNAPGGSDLVVPANGILNIGSGGFLVTNNVGGTPSLMGGALVSGAAELVITQDSSQTFEIGSSIRISAALTKTGAGTLLFSGSNDYTGPTEIQDGILQVTGNSIGDTSLVTLADDHTNTLQLLASETIGRLQGGSASTGLTNLATVDIGSHTLTINQSGSNTTYSGLFTGAGNMVKQGTHNLALAGISTGYTGVLTVDSGMLQLFSTGQINASIIRVNKGGALIIDNNGTTRSGTRILDTTPVTLNSADGTFNGQTIVRGLAIRTDQDTTLDETVGLVTAASGASYIGMEATTANDDSDIIVSNLLRLNNATLNVRGTNLGTTSAQSNQFRIGDATNQTAFISALAGGGGAAGSQNISIVPWAIGETTTGALADGNMGNSLVTYVSGAGFRPLSFATEYDTLTSASATENARESRSTDLTSLGSKTVNSLVIDNQATTGLDVTGSGPGYTLAVTSGAMLFTLSGGADSTSYDTTLGGFDDGITVGATNEYIFHVVNPSAAAITPTLTAAIASPLTSTADITKSGRGTLILNNTGNIAGGGSNKTTLNEGALQIADLDNIGGNTGTLVFAGGTLRFDPTLTDDISLRTITLLPGGGTIDTNGVSLILANAIGNGGTGGFTKSGLGTLTLNAAANWTGSTTVSGGTLLMGVVNAITPDVIVAGGTLNMAALSPSVTNLTLGPGTGSSVIGSGSLTVSNVATLNEGSIAPVLTGPMNLIKAGTGLTASLDNAANTYTGYTWIQGGTLSVAALADIGAASSPLGAPTAINSAIYIGSGGSTDATLLYTGTAAASTNRPIFLTGTTGGAFIDSGSAPGGLLTMNGIAYGFTPGTKALTLQGSNGTASAPNIYAGIIEDGNGVTGLTKLGTGTWQISNTNTYTGTNAVQGGLLQITGSVNNSPTGVGGSTSIGTAAGSFGSLDLPTGGSLSTTSFSVGTNATGIGSLVIRGGSATTTSTNTQAGISVGTAGYGALLISDGSFTTNRISLYNSATGTGVFQMSGGYVDNNEYLIMSNLRSEFTITGGTLDRNGASQNLALSYNLAGTSVMNMAGGTVDNTGRNISFGQGTSTGKGILNLAAGTLTTNAFTVTGTPAATINFNGGTLKAAVDSTTFVPSSASLTTYVYGGGAIIDSNGKNITIASNLLSPTGSGVTSLTLDNAGSGYIGAPYVEITGDGTGATGYATIDSDPTSANYGKLTGVFLTNPGVGYTSTPTVTLHGGGGTSASVSADGIAANTSGGLTKTGLGTLTLSGATLDYTGATTVDAGTLNITGSTASAPSTTGFTVAGGATLNFVNGVGQAMSSLTSLDLGAGGGAASLGLELGDTFNYDSLGTTGIAALANTVNMNILPLSGFGAGSYTLLSGTTGSAFDTAAAYTFNLPGGYTYSQTLSDTSVILNVGAAGAPNATLYWLGGVDGKWTGFGNTDLDSNLESNWTTDLAGASNADAFPDATTTAIFSTSNIAASGTLATTLEQALTLSGLVFNNQTNSGAITAISIAPGAAGSLTLNPSLSSGGIEIQSGAPASVTIGAPVALAANQTWSVADGNTLDVSGVLSGGGTLDVLGGGTVNLTGTNTFTNNLVVSGAGSTLGFNSAAALNIGVVGTQSYTAQNGGTISLTGGATVNPTATSLKSFIVGAGGGTIDVADPAGILQLDDANQFAGTGNLTKTGPGMLWLGSSTVGFPGYTGSLVTVNGGELRLAGAQALGATGAQAALELGAGSHLHLRYSTGSNFGSNVTVTGDSMISTNRASSGAAVTHTLGTLGIGAQTLTVQGGDLVTSGTAGLTFGATTFTGSPTFVVNNPAGGGTALLTFGAVDNGGFTAAFQGNGNVALPTAYTGAGGLTLDPSFTGTLTLSGTTIDYTGATTVNGGTLNLTGSSGAPISTTAITVGGGGTLNFFNGVGQSLGTLTGLNLGAGGGVASLGFELGADSSPYDSFGTTAVATLANTINFTVTPLAGFGAGNYTLLSGAAGSAFDTAAAYTFNLPGGYSYGTTLDDTFVRLDVAASGAAGPFYWRGAIDNKWGSFDAGFNSNWTTDLAGLTNAQAAPGATTTAIFSASNTGASGTLATSFKIPFAVKDLIFNGETNSGAITGVSIDAEDIGTLTIASAGGIDVQTGAPATVSINAPLILGASQTWNVEDAGTSLNNSGAITDGGNAFGITKTGAGRLFLESVNSTFTGGVTLEEGTIAFSGSGANNANTAFGLGTLRLNGGTIQLESTTGGKTIYVPVEIGGDIAFNNIASGASDTLNLNKPITLLGDGYEITVLAGTSGDTVFSGAIGDNSNNYGFTKAGVGTLSLTGANTFGGNLTVKEGTLKASGSGTFGSGTIYLGDSAANANPVTLTAALSNANIANPIVLQSGTTGGLNLETTNNTSTFTWSGGITGTNDLTVRANAGANLIFETTALNFSGDLTNAGAGTGSVLINADLGSNVGAVTQNSSTSALNLAGSTIAFSGGLTVNAGTLNVTGSAGTPLATTSVTVAGGATLNLVNGAGQSLGTLTNLSLGLGSGTATLGLELGANAGTSDGIVTSLPADTANTIQLNITALSGFGGSATYNLLTAANGGLGGGTYQLGYMPGGYTYTLTPSDTLVQLGVTALGAGDFYWRGDRTNKSWAEVVSGDSNWSTDLAGSVDPGASPGALNSVIFSANGVSGSTISTTLDNNYFVNDLKFNANPSAVTAVTIASGAVPWHSLTIAPSSSSDGIDVAASAGTITISAPLVIGANQEWDVNATGASLVLSGAVSGSANVTLTNTGQVTFAADNPSYSGTTTISAGTVNVGSGGATGSLGTGNVVNNGALVFNRDGTFTVSNLISGTGTLTKQDTGIMNLDNNANSFAGPVTVSAGTLNFTSIGDVSGGASAMGTPTTPLQGTISLAGTLGFTGSSSQSTDRLINLTASSTLAANGTGGASVTYNGAISAAGFSVTLTGTDATTAGVIAGGITQTGTTADLVVNSGNWTLQGASTIADDMIFTGTSTVVNLNATSAVTFGASADNYVSLRNGAVVNLGADDAINVTGFERLYVAQDAGGAKVTLNMNTFNLSTNRLILGERASDRNGDIIGTGILTVVGGDIDLYEGTISAKLASTGTTALEKFGPGIVTFAGDNSGLASTGASIVNQGTLVFDYSNNTATKVRTASALDMRGANLVLTGNAATAVSQTVASFTLGSGGSSAIALNPNGQDLVLNLGAITRATNAQDGTIRFFLPAGTQSATNGITTTSPNSTFGLLGTGSSASADAAYATVDDGTGVWFATGVSNGTNNNIVALASTVQNNVSAWVTGDNITDSGAGFTGTVAATSINSLRLNAAGGSTVNLTPTGVLGIASGGILITDQVTSGTPGIYNGTLFSGAQASNVPELVITQDGSPAFELSADIRTNSAVTKSGTGVLLLSGNNTYTGATEIQNGILQLSGGNAIGDTSLVTLATNRNSTLQLTTNETIGRIAGGQIGTDSNFGIVAIGANTLTLNHAGGTTTYAGVFTGTGSIVMSAASASNLSMTGISSGFTGAVEVNGGLFQLVTAGRNDASSFTINSNGMMLIDNNGTSSSTSRILDTTPIILNSAAGGGTNIRGLWVRNTDNNSSRFETTGNLVFNSGASYLTGEANVGTGTAIAGITANHFVRHNNATVSVRGRNLGTTTGHYNQFRIGTSANQTAFIAGLTGGGGSAGSTTISIVPWAIGETHNATGTAGTNMGNSLVTYVSGAGFRPLDFTTEYATYGTPGSTHNVREVLTADATGLPGLTLNSLTVHNNSTAASNIAITGLGAGQALTNTSGAFLFTLNSSATASSAHKFTASGFNDGILTGSGEYLFYVVNPSAATTTPTLTVQIDSPLVSTADITKSGRGTLILTTANTAGGGSNKTTLNEGVLEIGDLDHIGGNTGDLVFAGGTLRLGSGLTDDLSTRAISFLTGGGTLDTNGISLALANSLGSGAGGFTKTGAGTLTLNAAATYTGPTTISTGTVTVGASNALGNGGDLALAAGTTLALGTNSLTHGLVTTSGASPQITGTGTITASTGFFLNHTGNTQIDALLAGPGGLLKAQTNTVTLTGANTYTGTTEIHAGTLSFDSIANVGGGASALGAPATAEDGIIRMGLTTVAASLTYTGSGHASDRLIGMQGTTGGVTLNGNGTGAVGYGGARFENAGNKTLTLTGTSDVALVNSIGALNEAGGVLTLNKTGANTWLLDEASNYTGVTTISAGALRISHGEALGSTVGGTSISAGGALQLDGGITVTGEALALTASATGEGILSSLTGNNEWTGDLTVNTGADASNRVRLLSEAGSHLLVSGNVNLSAGTQDFVIGGDGDGEISGTITGSQRLFKSSLGAGTWTLSADNSATFTGKTYVSNGALQISSENNLGATPGSPVADQLRLGGGTTTGRLITTTDMSLSANRGVTLAAGGGVFNTGAGTTLTVESIVTGAGSLTKNGDGTLLLSGTNSYTGDTTVSAGTLLINGSTHADSDITIDSGATLGGSLGTIGGNVTANGGTLTAGTATSISTLTIGGSVTASASSTWLVNLTSIATGDLSGGTSVDLLAIGGNISNLNNFTLQIVDSNLAQSDNYLDKYKFLSFTTGNYTDGSMFLGGVSGVYTANNSGRYTIGIDFDDGSGNGSFYLISAIPEPEVWLPSLLILALGLFLRRRRAAPRTE